MSKDEGAGSAAAASEQVKSGSREKTEELAFKVGEVIGGFKLIKKIDEGGFGQVFKVTKDAKTFYAMKLELNCQEGGSAIKLEMSVLNQLPMNSVFPNMKCGGRRERFHFLVLELLGDNLKMLKARSPNPEAFTDGTWSRLGIQCLFALKTMHDRGFVHRDVKPSNFAIGMNMPPVNRSRVVLLFDFGLARKFVIQDVVTSRNEKKGSSGGGQKKKLGPSKSLSTVGGEKEQQKPPSKPRLIGPSREASVHKPIEYVYKFRIARKHTDFRGTQQYASPNAHMLLDLGRHDDIWSMMYMVVEMFLELPWSSNEEIPIEDIKSQSPLLRLFMDEKNPRRFSSDQYHVITEIDKMLEACNYYDHPNYELIYGFLKDVLTKSKDTWDSPYDWEKMKKSEELSRGSDSKASKKSKEEKMWENPKDFFKIDKWEKLKKPSLPQKTPEAVAPKPKPPTRKRLARYERSMMSREDSANADSMKKELSVIDSKKGSEKKK